jgi:nucleotide-binding universal stress UspA family protein
MMSPSGHSPMIPERYARARHARTADSPIWRSTLTTEMQDHTAGAVVVGFDGSPAAEGAVRWAARQAVLSGARLDLVMAWEYPTSWGNAIPLPSDYDPAADAQSMIDRVIASLRSEYPSLGIHGHVIEGHPGDVLVEASTHGSLLVVASRGHRALSGLVLGSVSQHCATHAVCPVVVYREPKPAS